MGGGLGPKCVDSLKNIMSEGAWGGLAFPDDWNSALTFNAGRIHDVIGV